MKITTQVLAITCHLLVWVMTLTSHDSLAATSTNNDNDKLNQLITSCTGCHGDKGVSIISTQPNLAGQKQGYLAQQLTKFRDDQRKNPIMTAIASQLTDQQIQRLASHFSKQTNPKLASLRQNVAGQHVRARCVSCHGMQGFTVNQEWPNLAGQQKNYLSQQLLDFKSGQRQSPIMQVIANELNQQQITDVAEYYSQQKASD